MDGVVVVKVVVKVHNSYDRPVREMYGEIPRMKYFIKSTLVGQDTVVHYVTLSITPYALLDDVVIYNSYDDDLDYDDTELPIDEPYRPDSYLSEITTHIEARDKEYDTTPFSVAIEHYITGHKRLMNVSTTFRMNPPELADFVNTLPIKKVTYMVKSGPELNSFLGRLFEDNLLSEKEIKKLKEVVKWSVNR